MEDIKSSRKKPAVLNLKRRRYLIFAFSTTGILIIISALGWFFYAYKSKAEVANFYPYLCLGGWQNPQNAQGKPDLSEDAPPGAFNENNSAVLKNSISEIYCGGFQGDIPTNTNPTKALLKFSWTIKLPPDDVDDVFNAQTATSTQKEDSKEEDLKLETATSSSEFNINATTTDDIEATTTDENTKTNIENSPPTEEPVSWQQRFIRFVFAQEISETTETPNKPESPQENQAQTNEPQIEQEIINETNDLNADEEKIGEKKITEETASTPLATTTEDAIATTSPSEETEETKKEELAPLAIEPFLEILYTTDGTDWQSLGKITHDNWRNLQLEIPNFSWDYISTLQIKLKSEAVITTEFSIYLDGLWVEVEYPAEIEEEINMIEESSLISGMLPPFDKENFKLDPKAKHHCVLTPFMQIMRPQDKIEYIVNLELSKPANSYRVAVGNLPLGIKVKLKRDANASDRKKQLILQLTSNKNPQRGSFGLIVVFQELTKRRLIEENIVSTTVCQFNLIIESAPIKEQAKEQPDAQINLPSEPVVLAATTSETTVSTTASEIIPPTVTSATEH